MTTIYIAVAIIIALTGLVAWAIHSTNKDLKQWQEEPPFWEAK